MKCTPQDRFSDDRGDHFEFFFFFSEKNAQGVSVRRRIWTQRPKLLRINENIYFILKEQGGSLFF